MLIHGLPVPAALLELLDGGLWPRTPSEAMKQNLHCLVSADRIREFAPEEDRIYLYAPPFARIADGIANEGDSRFYSTYCATHQLVPELTLDIADFGLGSDAPIVLDYQFDRTNPRVIRLRWDSESRGRNNRWVECADNFEQFAALLFG